MKKGSGFEKFYKGKEKTGGAKKEAIRQEKRQVRKEREEEIAAHKRFKRAQARNGSPAQPPKYNLEPPAARSQRKPDGKPGKSSFKLEKKSDRRSQDDRRPLRDQRPEKRSFEKKKPGGPQDRTFQPREKGIEKRERPFGRTDRPYAQRDKPFARPERRTEKRGPSVEKRGKPAENRERPGRKPTLRKNTDTPGAARTGDTGHGRSHTPAPKPQVTESPMPLNKYIAHSGVCSRRDAVSLIKGGKVKVNGELILEPGHKVLITDEVKVAGKRLNPVKDFVYILLNKPKDYITTTEDPQQRKTVLDLLKNAPPQRIYPVGRLDRNTSGVLLLTNDGDLSQKLTHPSNEIKKVYAVTLDKPLTRHHYEQILKGVPLDDGPASVDMLAYTDSQDHTQLGVELHSGRNRIVRRIFEHLGYDVKALDRVVFAGLTKKNVNRGKWRFLTEKEVRDLKFFRRGR